MLMASPIVPYKWVSSPGTGIRFSPPTRFQHLSGDAVQALGSGITLDRPPGLLFELTFRGGEGIFWGSYDEAGIFRGRGSAQLNPKLQGGSRLRLVVRGNSVDIFVDDQAIATRVRLPRAEGWISLVAYGGPVTLANVEISVGLDQ